MITAHNARFTRRRGSNNVGRNAPSRTFGIVAASLLDREGRWVPSAAAATAMIGAAAVAFGMVTYFARSLTDAGMAPAAVIFFR
jgi:hypothetical protein